MYYDCKGTEDSALSEQNCTVEEKSCGECKSGPKGRA